MEHRCSVRKPVEFQLLIYKNGLPVQSSISRNLGLGGIYIRAGTSEWRKHECLEIEFLGHGKAGMRLPAVVVHQSAQGVGLMFDGISSEQRLELRTMLFSSAHDLEASVNESPVVDSSRAVA
jgi:hypothetical protein